MSSSAVEPLRVRKFRALWAASVVSNMGSFLQNVAASWLMLELTDSALWVAAMTASYTLPLLFFALLAGALADLFDRRRLLLTTQLVMGTAAAAMSVLYSTGHMTAPILLVLGFMLGTGLAFNTPAWQAMVPDLVPRGMVASAVALNSVAFNVARAVGPAMGGLIVAVWGPGVAFGANALSFVVVITVVARFGGSYRSDEPSTIGAAMAGGIRYARYTPAFRLLLLVAAGFAITSAVQQAVLPNFTQDQLGGGALMFGALLGAMGIGALVGAFTRSPITSRLGAATVPFSMMAFGAAGVGLALSPHVVFAALAMAVSGLCWVWTLSTLNATVQLLAPAWVRGRAMSLYLLAFTGILPLGSLLAGVVADIGGTPVAIAVLSIVGIAFGAVAARLPIPSLQDAARIEHEGDLTTAPHPEGIIGSPVMVLNSWVIDEDDLGDYLATMAEMRMMRLRTGAMRWRLYRNVDDPHRMTEMVVLGTWDAHLAQHRRIDKAASDLIRRARSFDQQGGPVTYHLAAVDVVHPELVPNWEELFPTELHERLHETDGSIPLPAKNVHK